MKSFPEIDAEEIKVAVLDFDRELEDAETVASVAITVTVHKGTDDSPQAVLVGSPQLVGRQVLQRITGRVDGCIYKLRARAMDTNGLAHVIPYLLPCKFN
ncbi:hypothetical protein [Hydrogenophaga sp.]|uniref:hypothetical protein n=1 Tax=Hydrogenophaga sp. TaxID=1904254 RepID=UPI003D1268E1